MQHDKFCQSSSIAVDSSDEVFNVPTVSV